MLEKKRLYSFNMYKKDNARDCKIIFNIIFLVLTVNIFLGFLSLNTIF